MDTTSGRRKKQNILLKWGAENESEKFYKGALRDTSVSVFFFKTPTQKLKLLTFAKK